MYQKLEREEKRLKFIELQSRLRLKSVDISEFLNLSTTAISKWRTGVYPVPESVLYSLEFILLRRNLGFSDFPE